MATTTTKASARIPRQFPSEWPMSDLVMGPFYGLLAGSIHLTFLDHSRIMSDVSLSRWSSISFRRVRRTVQLVLIKLLVRNPVFLHFAAYGFVIESAFTLIHPPWSMRNQMLKRRQEQRNGAESPPLDSESLQITDPNNWALGGTLGGVAFAAVLPLRGGKVVVRGWRRFAGAAAFGAFAGNDLHDRFRNHQEKAFVPDLNGAVELS